MGFEQLAALRDQLAKEARRNAPAEAKRPDQPARKSSAPNRPKDKPAHENAPQDKARQDPNGGARDKKQHTRGPQNRAPRDGAQAGGEQAPREQGQRPHGRGQDRRSAKPAEVLDPVLMAIARVQRKYPLAFPKNPAPKLPLKLGIHKDLIEHAKELDLDEAGIRLAIKTWCEGRRYWACMTEGAPRIDLLGEPNGAVTKEEAARAKSLAARAGRKAFAERKAAAASAKTAEGGDVVAPVDAGAAPAAADSDTAAMDGELPVNDNVVATQADAHEAPAIDASTGASTDTPADVTPEPAADAAPDEPRSAQA